LQHKNPIARHEVIGLEGRLLYLGVVVGGIAVQRHPADFDQRIISVRPNLGQIERVEAIGRLAPLNDVSGALSDGKHVGAVDHKESADGIMLTKDDPNAGGRPHIISIRCVDYVDDRVHLNKPAKKAMAEWKVAA
jgi:hypothetical protein